MEAVTSSMTLWNQAKKAGRTISAEDYYNDHCLGVDYDVREGLISKDDNHLCVLKYDVSMKQRTQKTEPVWFAIIGNLAQYANPNRTWQDQRAIYLAGYAK
jgi:hypothetical protein